MTASWRDTFENHPFTCAGEASKQINPELQPFYRRLLQTLHSMPKLTWVLLETVPAWASNPTNGDFICFGWLREAQPLYIIVVNYANHESQCYVRFPVASFRSGWIVLRDTMGPAVYERDVDALMREGLYLALPSWGYHFFKLADL